MTLHSFQTHTLDMYWAFAFQVHPVPQFQLCDIEPKILYIAFLC